VVQEVLALLEQQIQEAAEVAVLDRLALVVRAVLV
jgi:hypothetical protein